MVWDESDPATPFEWESAGKKELFVREMAKINHHRNCLLCHAPAANVNEAKNLGLLAKVPSPDEPLPPSISREYYHPAIDGPAIIATETYLRRVLDAARRRRSRKMARQATFRLPWSHADEAHSDEAARAKRIAASKVGAVSVNHQAALRVLRRTTSADAGTKSEDWRAASHDGWTTPGGDAT